MVIEAVQPGAIAQSARTATRFGAHRGHSSWRNQKEDTQTQRVKRGLAFAPHHVWIHNLWVQIATRKAIGLAKEKRKIVHEFKRFKAKAVIIKKIRLGRNKKNSPITIWGRLFSLKLCSGGDIADAKFASTVQVLCLLPIACASHQLPVPLINCLCLSSIACASHQLPVPLVNYLCLSITCASHQLP